MKIGLFIQSSFVEPYKENSRILKDYYKNETIKNNLDLEVYDYIGDPNMDPHIDNDTIYLKCNDNEVGEKEWHLIKFITENLDKYDVIIKTNSTTVLNIKFVYYYIQSKNYEKYTAYGSNFVLFSHYFDIKEKKYKPFLDKEGIYLNGNLLIVSREVFNIIFKEYKKTEEYFKSFDIIDKDKEVPKHKWKGLAEDIIVGRVLYKNHIKIKIFDNFIQIYENGYFHQNIKNFKDVKSTVGFQFKINTVYEIRVTLEPTLLFLITKFLEAC